MSDHSTVIVPLESWSYSSPELLVQGKTVDIGLFAEALIYYDCVAANITNQPQLSEFLQWFIAQDCLDDFLSLVKDGSVKLYDYSFITTAILDPTGNYFICNIQDPIQKEPNTFEKRFLYHQSVEALFPKARHRKRLYESFRGNVIEVKAEQFASTTENALKDYKDPRRNALILQAFVDEIYKFRNLGHPPQVEATVQSTSDGANHKITWNLNFNELAKIAGAKLNFGLNTPLTASALSNRLLWSAAQLACDLYLPQPMGMLVGDKLYESTERVAKAGAVIEELKAVVEFPDIRSLVNNRKLNFRDILAIRRKAQRFRDWLQTESERDRDAIIAYHNEVARETGLVTAGRKAISIFGLIGGGAGGPLIGAYMGGPVGAAVGGIAGSSIKYLTDLVSKIGEDWKPVVFGNWLRARIEALVASEFEEERLTIRCTRSPKKPAPGDLFVGHMRLGAFSREGTR